MISSMPSHTSEDMVLGHTNCLAVNLWHIINVTCMCYYLAHTMSGLIYSAFYIAPPPPLYSAQKSLIISTVYKMKFRFLTSSGSTNTATACLRHQLPLQTSFFVLPASIEAMLHSPYHMPYYVSSVSLLSLISTWDQISLTFIAHLKHFVVPL